MEVAWSAGSKIEQHAPGRCDKVAGEHLTAARVAEGEAKKERRGPWLDGERGELRLTRRETTNERTLGRAGKDDQRKLRLSFYWLLGEWGRGWDGITQRDDV